MENTPPSLDLFTLLEIALEERDEAAEAFDIFKQDAVMAHAPEAGHEPAVTSEDAADAAAEEVDGFSAEVNGLLQRASDEELSAAYRQSGGEVGNTVAEALLGELKRRNLGI
ncbi:hypothetical protein EQZ23_00985 [Sphingomonas sp. UV9]|uniref:hypothetical protein n=1 Tax=Sphingomonas sp. UV9 TaxID=1851410 RepID=UPI000FFCC4C2|nr:hypothetical protein [Sphingomonas sp. UV9]RXD06720.1 hypothetical protein EQZ23_00985 [Sphingomonas sp. UV9]